MMRTSRPQVDRLLDPQYQGSFTVRTLARAARVVGKRRRPNQRSLLSERAKTVDSAWLSMRIPSSSRVISSKSSCNQMIRP
jgi:hypothetical protein